MNRANPATPAFRDKTGLAEYEWGGILSLHYGCNKKDSRADVGD